MYLYHEMQYTVNYIIQSQVFTGLGKILMLKCKCSALPPPSPFPDTPPPP